MLAESQILTPAAEAAKDAFAVGFGAVVVTVIAIGVIVSVFSSDGLANTCRAFMEGFASIVSAARGNDPATALIAELRARADRETARAEREAKRATEAGERADGAREKAAEEIAKAKAKMEEQIGIWFKQVRDLESEIINLRAYKLARKSGKETEDGTP